MQKGKTEIAQNIYIYIHLTINIYKEKKLYSKPSKLIDYCHLVYYVCRMNKCKLIDVFRIDSPSIKLILVIISSTHIIIEQKQETKTAIYTK